MNEKELNDEVVLKINENKLNNVINHSLGNDVYFGIDEIDENAEILIR